MGEKPVEQLDIFKEEDKKAKEKPEAEYAPRICQYCEDSGPCDYCPRGRQEKFDALAKPKAEK